MLDRRFHFSKKGFILSTTLNFILFNVAFHLFINGSKTFLIHSLAGSIVMATRIRQITRIVWLLLDIIEPVFFLLFRQRIERCLTQFSDTFRSPKFERSYKIALYFVVLLYGPALCCLYVFGSVGVEHISVELIIVYIGLNFHNLFISVGMLLLTILICIVYDEMRYLQVKIKSSSVYLSLQVLLTKHDSCHSWLCVMIGTFGPKFSFVLLSILMTQITSFYLVYEGIIASNLTTGWLILYYVYLMSAVMVATCFTYAFYWKFGQISKLVSVN